MIFTVVAAAAAFVFWLSDNAACDGKEANEGVTGLPDSSTSFMLNTERLECTDEDTSETDGLVLIPDCDNTADCIMKQRKYHSSALLKKEQKRSSASAALFIKVHILF